MTSNKIDKIEPELRKYLDMTVEEFLHAKKEAERKANGKLTYEEWYEQNQWEIEQSDDPCKKAWDAAMENK